MTTPIEKYNSDNILVRNVIAGVLSILNKSIKYEQVWENNISEEIILPWMYDLGSSDERLMQDNYTMFGLTCFAKKIDGNFDMFPRGFIRLESTTIDSDNICNRFVQGLTTRIENGKIRTYHSFLYSIPLTITFNCEIWLDNFTNMLKVEQALREYLYRNKTFYVLFRGMRIGCCMGMPNDYNEQKNTEYSLVSETGDQKIKLTFQLVVETYQPVFDNNMETPAECLMKGISFDVNVVKNFDNLKNIELFCDDVMIGGLETHIQWDYKSENSDMCTVNLEYRKIKDSSGNLVDEAFIPIEMGLANQSDFYWKVPIIESKNKFDIIYKENDHIKIIKEPKIKIIYNNELNENSFVVIDPGYFLTDASDGQCELYFDIGYFDDKTYKIKENFGYFNLIWSKIDLTDPVFIYSPFKSKKIKGDLSEYELRITDGINSDISSCKSNIRIY